LQGIDEKFLVLVRKGLDDLQDFTKIGWRIHALTVSGKGCRESTALANDEGESFALLELLGELG
jgi:hypothetical protein